MKTAIEKRDVFTNKAFKKKASIHASAQAFKALYSDTYTNKIGAVVRETVSNAIDAHNKAGNPNPVKVTLPNLLSLEFRVKDDGTGIHPDMLDSLYLDYFLSTKSDESDQIGGFGIGAKSPCSYTDQFDVINIYNGTRYHKKIILDEDGVPSIDLISAIDTVEKNGIEVIVPVDQKDVSFFVQEAQNQLRFLNPYPIISGNADFEENSLYQADEFYNIPAEYGADLILNVGGVGYPVRDLSHCDGIDVEYLETYARYISVVANVAVDHVSPALSRESLSYDKRTKEYLSNLLKRFKSETSKRYYSIIDSAKSWADIRAIPEDDKKFILNFKNAFFFDGVDICKSITLNRYNIDCYSLSIIYSNPSRSNGLSKHKQDNIDISIMNRHVTLFQAKDRKRVNWYIKNMLSTMKKPVDTVDIVHVEMEGGDIYKAAKYLESQSVSFSVYDKDLLESEGLLPPKPDRKKKEGVGKSNSGYKFYFYSLNSEGATDSVNGKATTKGMVEHIDELGDSYKIIIPVNFSEFYSFRYKDFLKSVKALTCIDIDLIVVSNGIAENLSKKTGITVCDGDLYEFSAKNIATLKNSIERYRRRLGGNQYKDVSELNKLKRKGLSIDSLRASKVILNKKDRENVDFLLSVDNVEADIEIKLIKKDVRNALDCFNAGNSGSEVHNAYGLILESIENKSRHLPFTKSISVKEKVLNNKDQDYVSHFFDYIKKYWRKK